MPDPLAALECDGIRRTRYRTHHQQCTQIVGRAGVPGILCDITIGAGHRLFVAVRQVDLNQVRLIGASGRDRVHRAAVPGETRYQAAAVQLTGERTLFEVPPDYGAPRVVPGLEDPLNRHPGVRNDGSRSAHDKILIRAPAQHVTWVLRVSLHGAVVEIDPIHVEEHWIALVQTDED